MLRADSLIIVQPEKVVLGEALSFSWRRSTKLKLEAADKASFLFSYIGDVGCEPLIGVSPCSAAQGSWNKHQWYL